MVKETYVTEITFSYYGEAENKTFHLKLLTFRSRNNGKLLIPESWGGNEAIRQRRGLFYISIPY